MSQAFAKSPRSSHLSGLDESETVECVRAKAVDISRKSLQRESEFYVSPQLIYFDLGERVNFRRVSGACQQICTTLARQIFRQLCGRFLMVNPREVKMESLQKDISKLDTQKLLHMAIAEERLSLVMFGDQIAKSEGYKVDGFDAIYLYLFEKKGVDPARARKMHYEAIKFLLWKELDGWVRPAPHRVVEVPRHFSEAINNRYGTLLGVFAAQADIAYRTEKFGDFIGERERLGVEGREALEIYLCRKFGFRPDEVSSWSWEVITSLLTPEISEWKAPIDES